MANSITRHGTADINRRPLRRRANWVDLNDLIEQSAASSDIRRSDVMGFSDKSPLSTSTMHGFVDLQAYKVLDIIVMRWCEFFYKTRTFTVCSSFTIFLMPSMSKIETGWPSTWTLNTGRLVDALANKQEIVIMWAMI